MTVIVIPWRGTSVERAQVCAVVCATLRGYLPGVPLLLVDSGHEPFNRAASRNHGIRSVHADPGEVAVVSDADVLPDRGALLAAVDSAGRDGQLHYPFTTCHYLTGVGSAGVLAGEPLQPGWVEFSIPGAQGGLMVIRASSWLQAGGMDERFTGWGYEDNAWHTEATRHLGNPVRHPGDLLHLWHPVDRNTGNADETENLALARQHQRG